MSSAEVTLPNWPLSVPTARRFVESVLVSWGMPDLGWDAAMITSELTTNAALHAGGAAFTVAVLSRPDGSVRLTVRDGSVRLPQQRSHSATATTGRGLRIVAELSADWGVESAPDGKTVWVELRPAGAGGPEDEFEADVDLDAVLPAFDVDDDLGTPSARLRRRAVQWSAVALQPAA